MAKTPGEVFKNHNPVNNPVKSSAIRNRKTPMELFKTLDPELLKLIKDTRRFALETDGALPRKYKYLIAMAMDSANGAVHSVTGLAKSALAAGATREEIAEALRVACYIRSAGSFNTAGKALEDLF